LANGRSDQPLPRFRSANGGRQDGSLCFERDVHVHLHVHGLRLLAPVYAHDDLGGTVNRSRHRHDVGQIKGTVAGRGAAKEMQATAWTFATTV